QNATKLWRSDGTAAGTTILNTFPYVRQCIRFVCDLVPNPADLTNVNGTLLFAANDGLHGFQLWKSDGTAGGTMMVTSTFSVTGGGPSGLTDVNGTLFFSADDGI